MDLKICSEKDFIDFLPSEFRQLVTHFKLTEDGFVAEVRIQIEGYSNERAAATCVGSFS